MSGSRPIAAGGGFAGSEPQDERDGSRTWIVRAANFVVAYSELDGGAVLERESPDEHLVLVPRAMSVVVATATERAEVAGPALVVVPPGPSSVHATAPGRLSRMASARAEDLVVLAANAEDYEPRPPGIAPLVDWPDPVGGFRLRSYQLDEHEERPGVVGRIFRCTNLMVNVFSPWTEPRDPTRLTPHSHDDFEQCSLTLAGDFVHHLRDPWGPDMTAWSEDEHLAVKSPAAVVFGPTIVHTSQNVGDAAEWQIVDVFAPPRLDFSRQPGFVRNAGDYPMPA